MLTKFETGKKYRYKTDIFIASGGQSTSSWVYNLDGKEVTPYNEDRATVDDYIIQANWCEEIVEVKAEIDGDIVLDLLSLLTKINPEDTPNMIKELTLFTQSKIEEAVSEALAKEAKEVTELKAQLREAERDYHLLRDHINGCTVFGGGHIDF